MKNFKIFLENRPFKLNFYIKIIITFKTMYNESNGTKRVQGLKKMLKTSKKCSSLPYYCFNIMNSKIRYILELYNTYC